MRHDLILFCSYFTCFVQVIIVTTSSSILYVYVCVVVRFKIAITLTLEEVKAFSSAAPYCVTPVQKLKFLQISQNYTCQGTINKILGIG